MVTAQKVATTMGWCAHPSIPNNAQAAAGKTWHLRCEVFGHLPKNHRDHCCCPYLPQAAQPTRLKPLYKYRQVAPAAHQVQAGHEQAHRLRRHGGGGVAPGGWCGAPKQKGSEVDPGWLNERMDMQACLLAPCPLEIVPACSYPAQLSYSITAARPL